MRVADLDLTILESSILQQIQEHAPSILIGSISIGRKPVSIWIQNAYSSKLLRVYLA
jgi:hypothetical protein